MAYSYDQLASLRAQGAEPGFILALQRALAGFPSQTDVQKARIADNYWTLQLGPALQRDARIPRLFGGGLNPNPGETEVSFQYRLRGLGQKTLAKPFVPTILIVVLAVIILLVMLR